MTTSELEPRVERLAGLTIVLAAAAAVVVECLTVVFSRQVDPVTDPVSDYALHNGGEPLFVLAVSLMIGGGLAARTAMTRAGLPSDRALSVLFGLWYAGLGLVAVFPGNKSVDDTTVAGEIHRFGGALFLTCLPVACLWLAKLLRPQWTVLASRVQWFGVAGGVASAAFGLAQVDQTLPLGLTERFALGAQLALLVVLAWTVRRTQR